MVSAAYREAWETSMWIFSVDDKIDELERASAAIKAAGHMNAAYLRPGRSLGDISQYGFDRVPDSIEMQRSSGLVEGIITDLMFHPGDIHCSKEREWPTGIFVVMFAIRHNVPCVVCTSSEHGEGDFGRYFLRDARITGPLVDMEMGLEKDWDSAVKKLELLVEKQKPK